MNETISAFEGLKTVFLAIGGIIAYGLFLWVRRSKDSTTVHGESVKRSFMDDLQRAARDAREKADKVLDDMGKMQRRLGELEAENKALSASVTRLEEANDKLSDEIARIRERRRHDRNSSDYEGRS